MSGRARVKKFLRGITAATVLTAVLGACATPTDRELLYAEEPNRCKNGDTPTCFEKMGQQTECYCTNSEGLRELFELGGKY